MKELFYSVGLFSFLIIMLVFIFAPTKGQTRIFLWSLLKLFFFVSLFYSWQTDNIVLKWILIEASTLFGAILISASGTEKSFQVGWKFLLINSYSLGLSFLGIILLLFASKPLDSLTAGALLDGLKGGNTFLTETGLVLTIYGYTGKLGLLPNHFWVGDTYAESPSQTSSIIAAFVPVSVALAIRPLLEIELSLPMKHYFAHDGVFFLGIITLLYSMMMLILRLDIRRITAKIALFHSALLGIFLALRVGEDLFFYLLSATILLKLLLFIAMGILRMDAGKRTIPDILATGQISNLSFYAYFTALLVAFVFPLSPTFVLDLNLIQLASETNKFSILVFPLLSVLFFFFALRKVLPLMSLVSRDFFPDVKRTLYIRLFFYWLSFVALLFLGIQGYRTFLGVYL